MNNTPLRYDIHNEIIMRDLMEQGFTIYNTTPGIWTMEAPPDLTASKARKLISACIKLYVAAKDLVRAKQRYERMVEKVNDLNMCR
jgi:hypothetical protein